MHWNSAMSEQVKGPTVVLVGGAITLDSGERIDSRQPLADDKWDFILRSALAGSELWWEAARKLVDVILDEDQTDGAWALTWAPKTLWQPKADGSAKRIRIRAALQKCVSLMDLRYQIEIGGYGKVVPRQVKINASKTTARYRVLEHPFRYEHLVASRPPTVFFGAHPTAWDQEGLSPFGDVLRKWPNTVFVLAHTPLMEATIARVQSWFSNGRKPRNRNSNVSRRQEKADEEFFASMKDFSHHRPMVVDADFSLTYFLDSGSPGSAADLDAALTFVLSRYDLNIGLWDLARDPGLRESLLSPEELESAPSHQASMPVKLSAIATEAKLAWEQQRRSERVARRQLHNSVWPLLKDREWRTLNRKSEGRTYVLPKGKPVKWADIYDPSPILYFALDVTMQQAVLRLKAAPFGFEGIPEYLHEHGDGLRRITGERPTEMVICRFQDHGWKRELGDWDQTVQVVDAVVKFLDLTISTLRSKAEEQFADFRSKNPPRETTRS